MTLTDCIKAIRVAKRYELYARVDHKDSDKFSHGYNMENLIEMGQGSVRFVDQMCQYSDCGFFIYFVEDDYAHHIEKSLASAIEYIVTRAQS